MNATTAPVNEISRIVNQQPYLCVQLAEMLFAIAPVHLQDWRYFRRRVNGLLVVLGDVRKGFEWRVQKEGKQRPRVLELGRELLRRLFRRQQRNHRGPKRRHNLRKPRRAVAVNDQAQRFPGKRQEVAGVQNASCFLLVLQRCLCRRNAFRGLQLGRGRGSSAAATAAAAAAWQGRTSCCCAFRTSSTFEDEACKTMTSPT